MIQKSTLSRLAILFVAGTVLMTGLTGAAAAFHPSDDVDQDATVVQKQDSDQTNWAFINKGDQKNDAEQDQTGVAANINDGSGDVDQDAFVYQDQDSDQTNVAGVNFGDQTNTADQDQDGYAINYND